MEWWGVPARAAYVARVASAAPARAARYTAASRPVLPVSARAFLERHAAKGNYVYCVLKEVRVDFFTK